MEPLFSNYCTDCEWVATRADNTAAELSERAIAHAVETGHNIDSTVDRPPNADERAEGVGGLPFDRSDPGDLGDRSDPDDPNDGPSKEVRCLDRPGRFGRTGRPDRSGRTAIHPPPRLSRRRSAVCRR